jgi:hypothetical protein
MENFCCNTSTVFHVTFIVKHVEAIVATVKIMALD